MALNRAEDFCMRSLKGFVFVVAMAFLFSGLGEAQEQSMRLAFEVATIKPSEAGLLNGGIKPLPGGDGYMAQNVSVRLMISLMYQVPMRQITGGPGWLDTDHYDVEAKADHAYSKEELHAMFRSLLEDRFKLKLRKETREGPVYALTVDKSGSKMKVNEGPQDYQIPITFGRDNSVVGSRVSMQYLCWWLGQQLQRDGRPVIDKTKLDKNYDFTLTFAPERPPEMAAENPALQNLPSLFDALKEQLGLRLDPEKGPVEYYVVDRVERPSDN